MLALFLLTISLATPISFAHNHEASINELLQITDLSLDNYVINGVTCCHAPRVVREYYVRHSFPAPEGYCTKVLFYEKDVCYNCSTVHIPLHLAYSAPGCGMYHAFN